MRERSTASIWVTPVTTPAALREMMRVLVPGGHLTAAVWDTLEHTPAYASLVALLERHAGARAANALRAPFVLGGPATGDRSRTTAAIRVSLGRP